MKTIERKIETHPQHGGETYAVEFLSCENCRDISWMLLRRNQVLGEGILVSEAIIDMNNKSFLIHMVDALNKHENGQS